MLGKNKFSLKSARVALNTVAKCSYRVVDQTDKDLKSSREASPYTRDGSKMGFATVMVEQYQAKWKYIRDYSWKIRCMVKDSFIGLMGGFMKVSGTITRRTDSVNTSGRMDRCMKVSSMMIIVQVLEYFTIPMANGLKVNGRKAKSMVKGITYTQTVPCSRQCTGMERKLVQASSLIIQNSQQQRQK